MIRVEYDINMMRWVAINSVGKVITPNGSRYFLDSQNTVVEVKPNEKPPIWLTIESDEDAIMLVEGLLNAGLRVALPNDKSFDKGKLAATEQHLADLRRIVFEDKQ